MCSGDSSLVECIEDRPAFGAQRMRGTYLKIASKQAFGLFGYGMLHMRGKKRHADNRADSDGNTNKEIQKVAPSPSGFPPGHGEHEAAHKMFSPAPILGRISSDSMRPSRNAMTRCIKAAISRSWVTSTNVVP